MNCAFHADQQATGYCRNCGKPMCQQCTREVRSALYCEECLGKFLAAPSAGQVAPGISAVSNSSPAALPANPLAAPRAPNPALAALLGFIPGLGAVYNGQYLKGLIHVLIFGGLVAILSSDLPNAGYYVFFAIALGCFYFYMPIEAHHVARARRLGEPEPGSLVPGVASGEKPLGAFLLIGLGLLFLLANFGLLQEEWFAKSWPAGLIVLGGYLLWIRMRKSA
jgi:TM2 domain-containing membrane protein YozV